MLRRPEWKNGQSRRIHAIRLFDDQKKEYVITRPDTPQSWSNYLSSTDFGAVITNHAGGYGFNKSGAKGRFLCLRFNSVPSDQPGRYFYLRDRTSGDY